VSERRFKEQIYDLVARIGQAVDSPRRLEILEVLAQGPRTVDSIAKEAALSMANASRHLQVLRHAGVVETRKRGNFVEYRLADPEVVELLRLLRVIAERRLAEVDRLVKEYLGDRDRLEAVRRDELLQRARAGSVVVLDVRPREEFLAGHIAGAVSIPVGELSRRLREIPASKEVVAYCRGPYCLMAFEAVKTLRGKGRRARRLVEGFPEWRAAGLPVQAGESLRPSRGSARSAR
jgi:rhodanese-related sulfurtransferase/DNA-binding transcriptional ArsR family regulator